MRADDPRHGKRAGYNAGCREDCCRVPGLRAIKQYRARRYAMGGSTLVDATRATQMIRELESRMTLAAIGKAIGINSGSYVKKLRDGEVRRISPEREATILRLANYRPSDTSHVAILGATRRLQALRALGYPLGHLCAETGYSLSGLKAVINGRWPVIEAHHDQAIRDAYARLSMRLPTAENSREQAAITRARNIARRNGWPPPLAWDDIDDPTEQPRTGSDHAAKHELDEAVVLRVLAGERLEMTRAERVEVVRRALARGWSEEVIYERTGIAKATDKSRYGTEDAA